jgi:surface glycoprotein (TIGR04207 family)
MTRNNKNVRSLVLTAMLVLSVFAGTMAFAGSAAAASNSDTTISNNSVVYQGQDGLVTAYSNGTKATLSKGKDGNGGFVDTYTADGSGEFTIDTAELNTGFYQLSDGNTTITFQVVEQTFDVSADSTALMENSNDQTVSFSIDDSNREDFNVSVYSEDITDDESQVIASATGMHEDGDGNHTFDVDLSSYDLSPGTYNVTVSVDDTSASQTFEITVKEGGDSSSSLGSSVYSVPRGDVVPITVHLENTDSATVMVGSNESNFNMSVSVTDKDDDNEVTFWLNTYQTTSTDGNDVIYAGADSEDKVDATWESNPLSAPLAVTSGDTIYELATYTDSENPDDVGSLSVDPRSTGSAQTWIAPRNADVSSASDLTEAVSQRSNVAYGDYVVVQIKDTTGIYGAFSQDDLSDIDGLSLTVKEDNPEPNTEADTFSTDNDGVSVIDDGANKSLYVVIETDNLDNVDEENLMGDWTATFKVTDDYAVTPDDTESISTSFTVEKPTLELNDGNDLTVAPSDNQSISGTTNLAPGSSVNLQVRSSGVFFKNEDIKVKDDGLFSTMFDFSEYGNGTVFSATATATGADSVSVDGTLNQNSDEPTTTTTSSDNSDKTTTSSSEESTTTSNDDGQPGFGVAISVVALLALRREN